MGDTDTNIEVSANEWRRLQEENKELKQTIADMEIALEEARSEVDRHFMVQRFGPALYYVAPHPEGFAGEVSVYRVDFPLGDFSMFTENESWNRAMLRALMSIAEAWMGADEEREEQEERRKQG